MRIMLDINVMLDFFQKRAPHYQYSSMVVREVLKHNVQGFLPVHGVTTIYYIIAKYSDSQQANREIDWLLARFEIASAGKPAVVYARTLNIEDFEDALVAVLAESSRCDYIVTRNVSDFENSPIQVLTPEDFVKRYVFNSPPEDAQQHQKTQEEVNTDETDAH